MSLPAAHRRPAASRRALAGRCGPLVASVIAAAVTAAPSVASVPEPLPSAWRQAAGLDAANSPAGGGVAQLPAVAADMDAAAVRLAQLASVSAADESQRAALVKLDATLAELQRQCQQCMGGKSSKPGEKPGSKKPSNKRGGSQPNGSHVATGEGAAGAVAADAAEVARSLWGHLPQRQRDEMLQPLREEFLPEYAEPIEAYFRGLAEPIIDPAGAQ